MPAAELAGLEAYELTVTETIGYIGGVVLAVALVPQVITSLYTWSTTDISYGWQVIYIVGLFLNLAYFILVGAVAAWLTLLFEIACAIFLFFLKLRIDGCRSRNRKDADLGSPSDPESVQSTESVLGKTFSGLSVRGASRMPRRVSVTMSDKVKDVYRGFHFTIDATFTITLPATFGNDLMEAMLQAAKKNNVRIVNHMIEIFDGTESPPGFASACLIDESHMSAHCYTDQGLLAFDCFTCGANPNNTRALTCDVHEFLKSKLGPGARFDVGHLPRFPVRAQ